MKNTGILFAAFGLLATLSPEGLRAGVGNWTSNGPYGADVITLASHPSNPSTVYAATSQRLYKSVDAGASWTPTRLYGSSYLVVPTSDASVAYAATGDAFGVTFHRTIDGGETWVDIETAPGSLLSVAVDRNDPMTLYAGSSSGLFRTTNGGDVWEYLANPVAWWALPARYPPDSGSGPQANAYGHSSTPSMEDLGVGNQLEIVGTENAFVQTNGGFDPIPPAEFFTE